MTGPSGSSSRPWPSGANVNLLASSRVTKVCWRDVVTAKLNFLNDVRQNHPLSEKNVAYSDMMWAHSAGYIMDQAKTYLADNAVAFSKPHPYGGAFKAALRIWARDGCR